MSFDTIGQKTVWTNWGVYGSGSWNMWFMAPHGSWMYCGFSKNNISEFKKVYIGTNLLDYDIHDWNFDSSAINTPDEMFPNEPFEGYPDGSTNLGCIRVGTETYLYLLGHSSPAPATSPVIRRFDVNSLFAEELLGFVPNDDSSVLLNINHICGLEVDPGNNIFIVTNNRDTSNFMLYRYAYVWDGTDHDPEVVNGTVDLSTYITDNTQARIRGMSFASDGNILIFCNTGETATNTTCLKFDATNLNYLGRTAWLDPHSVYESISTTIWAQMIRSGEVFLYFRGLDSTNYGDRITQVFYDNATKVPDSFNSNFIINNNLTTFGSTESIELKYLARDGFNNAIDAVNCKFIIHDVSQTDSSSWDTNIGGIRPTSGEDFFDADGVPLGVHAVVSTSAEGEAKAYYRAMRTGTGTFIDIIDVFCPSDI